MHYGVMEKAVEPLDMTQRQQTMGEELMAVFNGVFPILAGQEQNGRDFAAASIGERRKGFEAQAARTGLARETWALQETPMGSFMLVWFEAPDIERAFTEIATSDDEFTVWFRGQIKEVTGVDLGAPPAGPLPVVLVDWAA